MGCLGVALAASQVTAQEVQWRPVEAPLRMGTDLGVTLSAPVPLPEAAPSPQQLPAPLVRCQAPDPLFGAGPGVPPPPPPPGQFSPAGGEEAYNCGQVVRTSGSGGTFWEQGRDAIVGIPDAVGDMFKGGGGHGFLESDHCFDCFCSPVSNPFFMRDPRSLTEIKPLLIYQHMPGSNNPFAGGDIWFYGVQGSVAINERWSIDVPKLGFISLHPHTNSLGISNATGFAEFMLGPKFTFIRNENSQTLLAAGVNFDLAIGGGNVFQDTGTLSLVPYLSFAQGFGRSSWGRFNFMNTTGYSAATDNDRTDFFFSSFHLDYNVANLNKIFPLIELNWFHYTTNGSSPTFFGFEGRDLINFGSGGVAGHNDLSLALGARYKFTESFQVGFALEFPLLNRHDLMDYRLGLDLIFRW